MLGIETAGGTLQAVVLVGLVLVEAILLYVVYGVLESVLGPSFKRVLEGQCALVEALTRRCSVSENERTKR